LGLIERSPSGGDHSEAKSDKNEAGHFEWTEENF